MRIVIAGGKTQADFLISNLKARKHRITVINGDDLYCHYLTETHKIPVFHGDPSKYFVLKEADIVNYDVLVALTEKDADNLAICQYAKRCFGIKKVICTVSNPKNVSLFKKLGIDNVISSTHMVAQYITEATTLENIIKTLTLENDKIVISEIVIEEKYDCVGKTLSRITLPPNTIIACIIRRSTEMIVPTGNDCIKAGDKLLVLTSVENQKKAITTITK